MNGGTIGMVKILIIGGTGNISLPTTKKLAADPENEVYVLNRGNRNTDLPANVKTVVGNINDTAFMEAWLEDKEFDSVLNFIVWDGKNAQENIDLFAGHTKQFIYVSTVVVLDHETSCNVKETSETGNKYSDYGKNKAAAEKAFLTAKADFGFPVTIVRPTQTYSKDRIPLSVKGAGCWSVISRMLQGKPVIVHGDGQSVWASTHSEDFAEGIHPIVGNPDTLGEIYHIVNPEPHTWDMVYQELASLLDVPYKPVYISTDLLRVSREYDFMQSIQGDKRWSNIFDVSKLKQINPDFECKIPLRKGLQLFLEYMDEHPELKVEEPAFDHWCDHTIALYESMQAAFYKELR